MPEKKKKKLNRKKYLVFEVMLYYKNLSRIEKKT